MERSRRNPARIFWTLIAVVVGTDVITKWLAVQALSPSHLSHRVLGDVVRFTLVYNRGAAFGLDLGQFSRWIFLALTLIALAVLWRLYRRTAPGESLRAVAIGLVCGGAVGNLIDRVRSPMGVVDFLDIGIGTKRWPTFNVADVAVSIGALLLAWVLWGDDEREPAPSSPPVAHPAEPSRGA
ncbi:MAG TPA: signal peptidase II [Gemmatimonadaceae bacterium]|nr:signal peptidase II [Gemmatimonadaceae bacterium]